MDSLSPKIEDVIDFTTRLPVGKISFKSSFSCFSINSGSVSNCRKCQSSPSLGLLSGVETEIRLKTGDEDTTSKVKSEQRNSNPNADFFIHQRK